MQDALLVKHRGRTLILRPADIQWISAEGDYVEINSTGRKFLVRDRISRLERDFAPGEFVRIHRSLLVNRLNVKELEPRPFGECIVILDCGVRLPMSRSRKTSVLKCLQETPMTPRTSPPLLHFIATISFLLTVFWSAGYGQQSAVQSLLAAEQAFANHSAATSADSAFRSFIAPDGVLLRPDPVNGRDWLHDHPSPTLMLRWRPALGVVSAAGDLGFTTGPFEDWETDDTTGARYHGEFMTAWKRQADGSWRFVFDFGAGHAQDTWKDPAPVRSIPTEAAGHVGFDTVGERARFLRGHDAPTATLSSDIRLLRPDSLPITGRSRAAAVLAREDNGAVRLPLFADVAGSGDLAYTYGSFTVRGQNGEAKRGYYFSIWKRHSPHSWELLWDVRGRAR